MISWRFECHESLGSTSDLCKEKAEAGEDAGLVVQALSQTSGRGTRGRHWVDPGGNLAVSFLLHPHDPDAFIRALPFIAALALYESIRSFCERVGVTAPLLLKWPNDLLLDGRKMAGILIETGGPADGRWVVIGVGANLRKAPDVPGRKLAALSEWVAAPDPQAVCHELAQQMERWMALWDGQGFASIRTEWLARAHPPGSRLAVQRCETYITGSFSGLDEQGCLLLTLPEGTTIPVITGDILLG